MVKAKKRVHYATRKKVTFVPKTTIFNDEGQNLLLEIYSYSDFILIRNFIHAQASTVNSLGYVKLQYGMAGDKKCKGKLKNKLSLGY